MSKADILKKGFKKNREGHNLCSAHDTKKVEKLLARRKNKQTKKNPSGVWRHFLSHGISDSRMTSLSPGHPFRRRLLAMPRTCAAADKKLLQYLSLETLPSEARDGWAGLRRPEPLPAASANNLTGERSAAHPRRQTVGEAPDVVPCGPGIPLGREVKEKGEKSDLYSIKNAEFNGESSAYLAGTLRGGCENNALAIRGERCPPQRLTSV